MVRWWIALTGLFLSIFAVVALSGPGRIDIVDGQTRYEVARSLVEHGDAVIRDSRIWFAVFPGHGGRAYCNYRLPQSPAGVAAILAADASGPASEARRHFFFTLIGAVACGVLAVTYAAVFRRSGLRNGQALLWAAGGSSARQAGFTAPIRSMISWGRSQLSWPSPRQCVGAVDSHGLGPSSAG